MREIDRGRRRGRRCRCCWRSRTRSGRVRLHRARDAGAAPPTPVGVAGRSASGVPSPGGRRPGSSPVLYARTGSTESCAGRPDSRVVAAFDCRRKPQPPTGILQDEASSRAASVHIRTRRALELSALEAETLAFACIGFTRGPWKDILVSSSHPPGRRRTRPSRASPGACGRSRSPMRSETCMSRSGLSWSSAIAKWVPCARTSSYSMCGGRSSPCSSVAALTHERAAGVRTFALVGSVDPFVDVSSAGLVDDLLLPPVAHGASPATRNGSPIRCSGRGGSETGVQAPPSDSRRSDISDPLRSRRIPAACNARSTNP